MNPNKIHELVSSIEFEKRHIKNIDKAELIDKLINDESHINQHFNSALSRVEIPESLIKYFDFIDLIGSQYFELALICIHETEDCFIWPDQKFSIPSSNVVLGVMSINILKSILAIKSLIMLEIDSQARVLFRSCIEYLDTVSAAMWDVDVFKSYLYPSGDYDEQYDNWKRNLSPKKIKNILKKYESRFGLDAEVIGEIHSMRDDTYQWLSQFTHASWPAQVVSAFGASDQLDVDKFARDDIHGSKYLLCKFSVYLNYFGMLLEHQLRSIHGWSSENKLQEGFLCKSAVSSKFFLQVYPSMLEDVAGT